LLAAVDQAAQFGAAGRADQLQLGQLALERSGVPHGSGRRLDYEPESASALRR